jgi:hypothetical protein
MASTKLYCTCTRDRSGCPKSTRTRTSLKYTDPDFNVLTAILGQLHSCTIKLLFTKLTHGTFCSKIYGTGTGSFMVPDACTGILFIFWQVDNDDVMLSLSCRTIFCLNMVLAAFYSVGFRYDTKGCKCPEIFLLNSGNAIMHFCEKLSQSEYRPQSGQFTMRKQAGPELRSETQLQRNDYA